MLVPLLDGWRPPSSGFVDSAVHPIRCHWEEPDDAELCDIVLPAAELSWDVQVDGLGFYPPMPDDDGILDIYLSDEQTGGGAYALGPAVDEDPNDGKRGCHAFIGIDPSIGRGIMPAFVAHEFNHVLQWATDFAEPTLPLWEGTAHSAEIWTIDGQGLAGSNITDFQLTPWMGLLGDGYFLDDEYGLYSFYEYGAAAWIQYLDHEHGSGDGTTAAALWDATKQPGRRNEPDVLDAFEVVAGEDALMEFSVARIDFGTESAPEWTEVLGPMPQLGIEAEVEWGTEPVMVTPQIAPYQTGSVYWRITGVPEDASVELEVEGAGASWGLLAKDDVGADWVVDAPLTRVGSGGDIVVGVVNLGEPGFDGDDAWEQSDCTLSVTFEEFTDGTGGDTDDDGGGDGDTDSEGAAVDGGDEGCACDAGGDRAPPPWLLVAMLPLIRRRRHP